MEWALDQHAIYKGDVFNLRSNLVAELKLERLFISILNLKLIQGCFELFDLAILKFVLDFKVSYLFPSFGKSFFEIFFFE